MQREISNKVFLGNTASPYDDAGSCGQDSIKL